MAALAPFGRTARTAIINWRARRTSQPTEATHAPEATPTPNPHSS